MLARQEYPLAHKQQRAFVVTVVVAVPVGPADFIVISPAQGPARTDKRTALAADPRQRRAQLRSPYVDNTFCNVGGKTKPVTYRSKHQWRDYETAAGRRPVKEFISRIPIEDRVEIAAAMKDVRDNGVAAARHLRAEIYEVRASGKDVIYRVLFAREGRYKQVLLALEAFDKKTQRTPPVKIKLAEKRLRPWRGRGLKKSVKTGW